MNELPLEIIVHIFRYLSKEEQIKISEVNKKFREALFTPTLWTESEKRIEVPVSQIRSFRKFLKQTSWLIYLNLLVKESIKKGLSTVNITIVFKPLNNLECLSLQLKNCNPRMTFFPRTLKHISLEECGSDITDDVLFRVADSCRQLEHIQIKSNGSPKFDSISLTYLLKKVERTLRTLILSIPNFLYPVFCFSNCPLNLTTLCLKMNIGSYQYCKFYCRHNLTMVPNLENLQFFSLGGSAESELLMSWLIKKFDVLILIWLLSI